MDTVRLVVPARRDYLALIRLVTTAVASLDPPLPPERLDDLRLAVSEACSNAIDAQLGTDAPDGAPGSPRRAGPVPPLVIECQVADDGITITVEDRGGGFDPDDLPPLPQAGDPARLRHERGLGLPLMRTVTDEVTFERHSTGTVVRLRIDRPTGGGR
jgi:anti-sigma regulatory factor (Ser/Thr protein kinase)